jgi:hypothetical protein
MPKKSTLLFLLTWLIMAVPAVAAEELEVLADFEGANPRAQEDILRESPCRFRLRPFNEQGSDDGYYFRFETRVVNHGAAARDVELLVEWPALDTHPDYEYDFYFYGDSAEGWHWTRAAVEGHTASLIVPARPGVTYVGFYPLYSYSRLEGFIQGLGESPYLKTWVEGRSFQGRNIRCVRITDPSAPDSGKRTVLFTARNHPYETGGSYVLDEAVRWLSGADPEAAALRRKAVFYLLPMLNPDGVALGCNQRTRPGGVNLSFGAGSDDPAAAALRGLVQKIHPWLWADIHSWPHKADDGMWCTHRWVADGLLAGLPDGTFSGFVWKVSFVDEKTSPDHLWSWLIRTQGSGGVSLSFSWYRRTEADLRAMGRSLVRAVAGMPDGGK